MIFRCIAQKLGEGISLRGCSWSESSASDAAVWVPAQDFTCLVEALSSAVGSGWGAVAPPVSLVRGQACPSTKVSVNIWCWLNLWERSAPSWSVVKLFLLLNHHPLMLETHCLCVFSLSADDSDIRKLWLSPSAWPAQLGLSAPGCTLSWTSSTGELIKFGLVIE